MRTTKLAILTTLAILPLSAMAGTIGNNVTLLAEYANTGFEQDGPTVHFDKDSGHTTVVPAAPGHWVREESMCKTYIGSIEFLPNEKNPTLDSQDVNVSFGTTEPLKQNGGAYTYPSGVSCSKPLYFFPESHDPTQKVVHFDTPEKARAFQALLEGKVPGKNSVHIRFIANDCSSKTGTYGKCSSDVENEEVDAKHYYGYTADQIEIAFPGDKNFHSLRPYLATVQPTPEEHVANQLNELTQKVESTASNMKAHAGNLIKEIKETAEPFQVRDKTLISAGEMDNAYK
jgi:hypothetical protein